MPRLSIAAGVLAVFLFAAPDDPAARVLADMREAIGSAALATLQSFTIDASGVKWACVLPDRCARVTFIVSTHTWGLNGDRLVWHWGYRPGRHPDPLPSTVQREWAVKGLRREFDRLILPLTGTTPFERLDAKLLADETIGGRPVRVIALGSEGCCVMRLRVDPVTNLPVMLSWTYTDGEHQQYFDDFRRTGGLLWPRRLTEYVGGRRDRESRFRKVAINPRIDAERFQPVK